MEKAVELCKLIYSELEGIYPALTGGTLYKDGIRKDIDICLFRNRQEITSFEIQDLELALNRCGLTNFKHCGFVTKAKWKGLDVDLFNPETSVEDLNYGDL